MVELEQQDAEALFGEPEVAIEDLMAVDADGRGVVSCLELSAVHDRPRLFSTFLMWLLADLFEHLPEVGDLDKPKLVFFFDEAHLLFADASKEFVEQVVQTVRLIRSKGVGVFFVTQLPDDVPDAVLGQLGNRVQHALRSYTPRDAKALKAAVTTYPRTEDYDLEQALTELGIGEAVVTTLTEQGSPAPVAWTKVRPPQSQIGAVDPVEVKTMARPATDGRPMPPNSIGSRPRRCWRRRWASPLPHRAPLPRPPNRHRPPAGRHRAISSRTPVWTTRAFGRAGPNQVESDIVAVDIEAKSSKSPAKDDGNAVTSFLKSREGRATVNNVVRGVFSLLKKRR